MSQSVAASSGAAAPLLASSVPARCCSRLRTWCRPGRRPTPGLEEESNPSLKYPFEYQESKVHPKLEDLRRKLSERARCVTRANTAEYRGHAYQYGTTSHAEGTMNPASIIYPGSVKDIVKIVNFAEENKIAIAVRTGGHQYSGASSTSGDNIQIDLSKTFKEFEYDESTGIVKCGVSLALLELNTRLGQIKCFMPHGQCSHVHVGGHCQSGGYGQNGRAHGLFCDHVQACQVVTADGTVQYVRRPVRGETDEENDELFWAIFGGSPGNFGILTHIWIKPLQDKDYPKSRGMKLFSLYSKEKVEKCLQIMARMSDDDDFPRDFDYCLTVASDEMDSWYFKHHFTSRNTAENVDQKQFFDFPEQYAEGVPEQVKGKKNKQGAPFGIMVIYLQWANTGGADQEFDDGARSFFEDVRKACSPNFFDGALHARRGLEHMAVDLKRLFGVDAVESGPEAFDNCLDYTSHTPMSELTRYWTYPDVREYVLPYEKRTYATDRTDLFTNGWAKWLAGRVDQLAGVRNNDLKIFIQIQPFGGKHSMYRRNGEDGSTCHSWRDVSTMSQVIDCFYKAKPGVAQLANEYQSANDVEAGSENGIMCTHDRRYLWGSYGRVTDPEGGANLHSVRDKYYDSEERYNKLVQIKRRVDPHRIFTPNAFCIDASSAPLIKSLDH